jgi:hypothetical protein
MCIKKSTRGCILVNCFMSLVTTDDLRERERERLSELTLLVIYIQNNKDDGGTGQERGKVCIV